jgi:hypothetical protein
MKRIIFVYRSQRLTVPMALISNVDTKIILKAFCKHLCKNSIMIDQNIRTN